MSQRKRVILDSHIPPVPRCMRCGITRNLARNSHECTETCVSALHELTGELLWISHKFFCMDYLCFLYCFLYKNMQAIWLCYINMLCNIKDSFSVQDSGSHKVFWPNFIESYKVLLWLPWTHNIWQLYRKLEVHKSFLKPFLGATMLGQRTREDRWFPR